MAKTRLSSQDIGDGLVAMADLADIATATMVGRVAAGTGAPSALSASDARSAMGLGSIAVLAQGWNYGSTLPAQPAYGNGVPFLRTDLGESFFYNGTAWLCTTEHPLILVPTAAMPFSVTNSVLAARVLHTTGSVWITRLNLDALVATTNDTTNCWTVQLRSNITGSNLAAAASTYGLSHDAWLPLERDGAGAAISDTSVQVLCTKTGSPGTLLLLATVGFRHVAT